MNNPILIRRNFFDSCATNYIEQKTRFQIPVKRFSCPCCGFPTLGSRNEYEICRLCWWEDDGQDVFNAGETLGGANHDYSLTDAQINFEQYLTMYPPENDTYSGSVDSEEVCELKSILIAAFEKMMSQPSIEELNNLWQEVDKIEKTLDEAAEKEIVYFSEVFD